MGCTQSKIENEEAVCRCKERRDLMKKAVSSRNEFAAAHTCYTMALKNTGGALSDYGQGEVQDTLLHFHNPPTTQHQQESLPPPPPPLPNFSPLKRATTMPEFVLPKTQTDPIQEEEHDEEDNQHSIEEDDEEDGHHDLIHPPNRSTDAGCRPPPSPPHTPPNNPVPPPPQQSKGMTGDYFFHTVENFPGPSLSDTHEIRPSDTDQSHAGVYNNTRYKRSDNVVNVNRNVHNMGRGGGVETSSSSMDPQRLEKVTETQVVQTLVKKPKQMVQSNHALQESRRGGKPASNVSLIQILSDLDEHFLKASESAQEVSRLLEATRLHYHSNFADNRGHIDHSARVMRVVTWNRSFRGTTNAGDGKDDFDAEEHETHASVLDKLLAWEKKLYDEVKAGELMKLEYQRKVALLNKQKKRGANVESLEKTKAAVSHLHTRYIVDMQSMDSTVSEINRLRDEQLYPKLVALVNGMAQMWDSMFVHHSSQLKIVVDLRSLDISQGPKETIEEHHSCTVQLWEVVQEWHSQFLKLVNHQKEYIKALNSWLKLNLIPTESNLKEKVSSPPRVQNPPIQAILYAWHEYLDKLPAELAGNAIFSFAGVIKTIIQQQEEELKLKEKCEEASKDYARKNRSFEDWYQRYMQRRTPPDEMEPDRTEDANLEERKFVVEAAKKRLEEEMEAHQKHCKFVREKSMNSLKTHLPELFRAISEFSFACSDMYRRLQSISRL